jgi:hypothetical protein
MANPDPKKTTPVANPEKLMSRRNPRQRPITPYTIPSAAKSSPSIDPKSKGKSSIALENSSKYFSTSSPKISIPIYPKESLPNSPKVPLHFL